MNFTPEEIAQNQHAFRVMIYRVARDGLENLTREDLLDVGMV